MILFNYFVLIVISFAVAYFTFGESASINTKNESVNGVELKTQTSEQKNSSELRTCSFDAPCGWYIYEQDESDGFGRSFKSFLLNNCKCKDKTYRCIRTWENLSAKAYVYHCRQNSTEDDKFAPDHDIYSRNDDPYLLRGIAPVHEVEPQYLPISKRNASLSTRSCGTTMACGWLVYRFVGDNKRLTSFILGRCKCDDGYHCILEREKMTIQAYLYYCMNTTSTERLAPNHDILKPNEELNGLYRYLPRK